MNDNTVPLLLLIRCLSVGGTERQVVELAKALRSEGREVAVIVFYGGGELEAELASCDVPVLDLGKKGRWDIVPFFLRLLRLLRSRAPVTLYSFLAGANIFGALARLCAVPTTLVWGMRASSLDLSHYDRTARLAAKMEILLSGLPDLVICNSEAGRTSAAASGFPAVKLHVVHNGIDTNRFVPDPRAREKTRRAWNVAPQEILVGIIARLDPMKDHPNFLRAAARLSMDCPHARFVCIGDGPDHYRSNLQLMGVQLGLEGKLTWAGTRQDTHIVLPALDLCCSASVSEGFSNAVAEAMACGVPCVVTDVGDSLLIVGETGLVVPPSDSEALAEGLQAMIPCLGPELARQVRQRIVDSFSIATMTAATARLIGDV